MIEEGKTAPIDLQITDKSNNKIRLRDILEKSEYTVLYFYPKDNTPGCTKQACAFRDFNKEINSLGAQIIGVSKDDAESHKKFNNDHSLSFELYSDEDQSLQEAFGVWVEKNMFGNKYMGTKRSTFIINREGKIIKIWKRASPSKNAAEVFKFLSSLIN